MTQPLSHEVPLVMYVDGERKIVGTAIVEGDRVTGRIYEHAAPELIDLISRSGPNEFSLGPVVGMHGFDRFRDDVPKIYPERLRLKDLDYPEIIPKDYLIEDFGKERKYIGREENPNAT